MRYLLILLSLAFVSCNSDTIGTAETTEGPAKQLPIHEVNDLMKEGLKGKVKTVVKTQVLIVDENGEMSYEKNKPNFHIIKRFDEDGFLQSTELRHDKNGTAQRDVYNYKNEYLTTIDHYNLKNEKTTVGFVKWSPPYSYTFANYGYSEQLNDTFAFEDYECTTLDKRYRLKTQIRIQGRDSSQIKIGHFLYFRNNDLYYKTDRLNDDTSSYTYRVIVLERDEKGNPVKEHLYWHGDTDQYFILHRYEYYQ